MWTTPKVVCTDPLKVCTKPKKVCTVCTVCTACTWAQDSDSEIRQRIEALFVRRDQGRSASSNSACLC
jgi:hypothetical protein